MEALACGTPLIAFDTGGLPDIVTHQKTGWLASAFNTRDLARGIRWILEDKERHNVLSTNARKYAEEHFSANIVAKKYKALYKNVLSGSKIR